MHHDHVGFPGAIAGRHEHTLAKSLPQPARWCQCGGIELAGPRRLSRVVEPIARRLEWPATASSTDSQQPRDPVTVIDVPDHADRVAHPSDLQFGWQHQPPLPMQDGNIEFHSRGIDPPRRPQSAAQPPTAIRSVGDGSHQQAHKRPTRRQFDRQLSSRCRPFAQGQSHAVEQDPLHTAAGWKTQRQTGAAMVIDLEERLVFRRTGSVAP